MRERGSHVARQRDIDNTRTERFGRGRRRAPTPIEPRMRFRQERTVPIPGGIVGTVYPRPAHRTFQRLWRRFGMAFCYTCLVVGGVLMAFAAGVLIVVLMH